MKKTVTFLSMMGLFLLQSNAQITVTRTDLGVIGDVIFYANDTSLSNISVGASGANKTWNFSTTVSPNYYDTSTFKDPATVPGAPVEANIAIDEGVLNGASFFNIDNNRVKTIIPFSDYGMDNQQLTITTFPLNFGDIIKDSSYTKTQGTPDDFGFTGTPYDSIRISIDMHTTSTVDGWGSLVVPSGTHNVLRVRNVTNVDVTVEGKFIVWMNVPINLDQNQILFAWYGNNKKYSIAEAYLDTNGVVSSFRYQVDSIPKKPTTGLANLSSPNKITAYPNPANERITFTITSSEGQLDIMDITGHVVLSKTLDSKNVSIDTQTMPAGVYMARMQDLDGNYSSLKFVVQH
ncbi:MAG: T9SS type A sorting domain-containing protein [Bacteroidota bacterium]